MKSLASILQPVLLSSMISSAHTGPIADGAKVEVLSEGYIFTEGPAVDRDGNVFFTDQPNDRIVKFNAANALSTLEGLTARPAAS